MSAKVINLSYYKKDDNLKKIAEEKSSKEYKNPYEEALKKMTVEEIIALEELLEDRD